MTLIIETGSGANPDAESFADVDYLREFAAKRKATVPEDDEDCKVLLILAMDYIRSVEDRLKGCRTYPATQPLPYPRVGVRLYGYLLASNVIPTEAKQAQCQLAIDSQTVPLLPTLDSAAQVGPVIEETVDVITTKYAAPTEQRTRSTFAAAMALLGPLLSGSANSARVVRT